MPRWMRRARPGAAGMAVKDATRSDLTELIRKAARHEPLSWSEPPGVPQATAAKLARSDLTRREYEVLRRVAMGETNAEIGDLALARYGEDIPSERVAQTRRAHRVEAIARASEGGHCSDDCWGYAKQLHLDVFRSYYNQRRPHRALDQRTPLSAFNARLKARLAPPQTATHFRVRPDKVDGFGRVTLRYLSQLRHIYVGRAHKHERIRLLVAGARVRIIREDGQLLRELTLDPSRDYQPRRAETPVHNVVRQVSSMS